MKRIGNIIKKRRLEKDISLDDFANTTGFDTEFLKEIERGSLIPNEESLKIILNGLDLNFDSYKNYISQNYLTKLEKQEKVYNRMLTLSVVSFLVTFAVLFFAYWITHNIRDIGYMFYPNDSTRVKEAFSINFEFIFLATLVFPIINAYSFVRYSIFFAKEIKDLKILITGLIMLALLIVVIVCMFDFYNNRINNYQFIFYKDPERFY